MRPAENPISDLIAPMRLIDFRAEAHRDPWSVPLREIDVSNPYLYSEDTWGGFFARLRRDDPVHFVDSPLYGPFWSVTRYRDIIDRPQPRHHLSFGFGIHRCVGNRLAKMQLTILWEEILKRFPAIEVVERPKRAYSISFTALPK